MRHTLLSASLLSILRTSQAAWIGRTSTTWDCCKPSCAWKENLNSDIGGSVQVCAKDDTTYSPSTGLSLQSSCQQDEESQIQGEAYLCSAFQPHPQRDDLAYAFIALDDIDECCRCYELLFLEGPAAGRKLLTQMINSGVGEGEIGIIVPGGGVGDNPLGCEAQLGFNLGQTYGGVSNPEDCQYLPDHLRGGCYWRFNWAQGDIGGWEVLVQDISCPAELTQISGCTSY